MFEQVDFTAVPGTKTEHDIAILALSTCGFCKRGMEFLQAQHFAYRFIYLDLIPPELKQQVKEEFKTKFQSSLSYPALVLDRQKMTIGFIKRHWEELLGIPTEEIPEVLPSDGTEVD